MLQSLTICNLVLVDRVQCDFAGHFIMLSGETGAGKSVFLSALGYLMGGKCDKSVIRQGAEQMEIIGEFNPAPTNHPLYNQLMELDIDISEEFIIRRLVKNDGKSKLFINNIPVSSQVMQEIAPRCVEIQTQHETHALLNPSNHLEFLDNFGQYGALLTQVKNLYNQAQTTHKKWQMAEQTKAKMSDDLAYWRESFEEIYNANIQPAEEESLDEKRRSLQNMEKNLSLLQDIINQLQGEPGVFKNTRLIQKAMNKLQDDQLMDQMNEHYELINNSASELLRLAEQAQFDLSHSDDNIVEIEERLYKLREMARKYRCTIDELPTQAEEFAQKITQQADNFKECQALQAEYNQIWGQYMEMAGQLSEKRQSAAQNLQEKIMAIFPQLKLEKARIECQIIANPTPNEHGLERVQIMASMNPGQELQAVHKSASGGELSRLLLALKHAMALRDPMQILVFDEIDSGMGGATAAAVGALLAELSHYQQCFVITHAPQIAALGDEHFMVAKTTNDARAQTHITAITGDERVDEIARMLSSDIITEAARHQAKILLKNQ